LFFAPLHPENNVGTMVIANHAAGIVVSKLGTATATSQELIDNIKEDPF
jgi:bifunctional ADP-heptose synthase (sugar kinase/adenylyltransferase)